MSDQLTSRTLLHLTQLVNFNTCNPPNRYKDSGMMDYLQQQLTPSGAKIQVMDHGNHSVNLLVTQGQPKYLFNFHMDTVPVAEGWSSDPFQLKVTEDKAYGLGSCDIKGAAAAMLAAIQHYALTDFALLFSSDEEHGNSTCIKEFLKNTHAYQGVIVAEPTTAQAITAHRGINTFQLDIKSRSGHSSEKRALSDNAIHQFAHWAEQATQTARQYEATSFKNLSGICFNIGVVEGGIKPNIIAHQLSTRFGIRPLPGQAPKSVVEQLTKGLTDQMTLTPMFSAPAFPAPVKEQASEQREEELAKRLQLPIGDPVNFWTEASLFSQAGYATIVYGPGDIQQAHAPDEFVEISQLTQVAENYARILTDEK